MPMDELVALRNIGDVSGVFIFEDIKVLYYARAGLALIVALCRWTSGRRPDDVYLYVIM